MRDVNEKKWVTDKKILFGENNLNMRLNEPGKRDWPQLGLGVINGLNLYIPYCINGSILTYFPNGATSLERGPYNNGVFHSADSGLTWHIEQASDIEAWYPACQPNIAAPANQLPDLQRARPARHGRGFHGPEQSLRLRFARARGDEFPLCGGCLSPVRTGAATRFYAGPQGCEHHSNLHSRDEQTRVGNQKSAGCGWLKVEG